jgi:hypothetical protein
MWFTARCSVTADHLGVIAELTPAHLPNAQVIATEHHKVVRLGDPWLDVFLWEGACYVGTPPELWHQLMPLIEQLKKHAPLSLLDLGLFVDDADRQELTESAASFVQNRHGAERLDKWARDSLLRPTVQLLVRRAIGSGDLNLDERIVHAIEVRPERDGYIVEVPAEILGQPKSPALLADLQAALEPLGNGVGKAILDIRSHRHEDVVPPLLGLEPEPEGDAARSDLSNDIEANISSQSNILIVVAGPRARQIARHIKAPDWLPLTGKTGETNLVTFMPAAHHSIASVTSPKGIIVAITHDLPSLPQAASGQPPSAVILLADDELLMAGWPGASWLSVWRQKAMLIAAPALPRRAPSEVLAESSRTEACRWASVVLDTARARSPFVPLVSRRALDRRIADMVAETAMLLSVNIVPMELRALKWGSTLPLLTFGVLPPQVDSRVDRASQLWLASETNVPSGSDIMFEAQFEAHWYRGRKQTVTGGVLWVSQSAPSFKAFAKSVLAQSAQEQALAKPYQFYSQPLPDVMQAAMRFPSLATVIDDSVERGPSFAIIAESPTLEAVRAAHENGLAITRYTDRETLTSLIANSRRDYPQIPEDIVLPEVHRFEENRRLAVRGVDARDILKIWAQDTKRLHQAAPNSAVLGLARRLRPGVRSREKGEALAFPRREVEQAAAGGDAGAAWLIANGLGGPGRPPRQPKRPADLIGCWHDGHDGTRRFAIADGSVPAQVYELDPDEVPSAEYFLVRGDSSVPMLFGSSLFSLWGRGTQSLAENWMPRFSISGTFETFPLSSIFRVRRKDDWPILEFGEGVLLSGLMQDFDSLHGDGTAASRSYTRNHAPGLYDEVDGLIRSSYDIPKNFSDIEVLERLVAWNHRNKAHADR